SNSIKSFNPNSSVRVSDDRSLSYMFDVEETFGRLNLYLDHLDMDLSEYLGQAITYDMDFCVSKTIGPPKKSTRNINKGIGATDGVEARTSTTDKGKEKVSEDATKVVQTRRSTVEIDIETEYDSDDDSDYQSDKEAKAKAKDNLVSEMPEPNNENSMLADNVRGETFEEHDVYMNQLLKSLNTANKDGITEDPFISVENMWRECLTYYALASGFSFWYERSGEVRVVAKCGQRLPRLSAPEKVFGEKIRANPDIRLCDIADLVMKKYKCKVSPNQCTYAKKYALKEYEKTGGEHYAMLRSYGKVILDFNPGSTVKLGVTVNPDGKTYIDRFYAFCWTGRWIEGRVPRKKRIRSVGEGGSSTRVSKVGGKASFSNCKKSRHNKAICTEHVVEQTPKPKRVIGRPRNKQSVDDLEDVDVVHRVPVRDEGVGGSRGCARGYKGGASVSRRVFGGSRRGSNVSDSASGSTGRADGGLGTANGSRGRGSNRSGNASGSRGRGAGGSKRKPRASAGTQKKKQGKKNVVQIQDEDQVEKTQEQVEIDMTQVEKTEEQTQDQVQPREQPQQVTLRTPSARILQRKLEKQGSSQKTTLNVDMRLALWLVAEVDIDKPIRACMVQQMLFESMVFKENKLCTEPGFDPV
nr:multidrug resistance-associated protein 5 [Tanacetum cinerariifolium]